MLKSLALTAVVCVLATGAFAADSGLPDVCKHSPMAMEAGKMEMAPIDEAHKALVAGMEAMHADMEQGMMAKDIDVAFICGMLPHHQGAIDMARAELQYGDDPWAKKLAQAIIDAQTSEIAAMKEWLGKQPK